MPNMKISELPDHGAARAGDVLPGNRGGSTGRIALEEAFTTALKDKLDNI